MSALTENFAYKPLDKGKEIKADHYYIGNCAYKDNFVKVGVGYAYLGYNQFEGGINNVQIPHYEKIDTCGL